MSTGTWQPTYYVQPSVSGWGEGRGDVGREQKRKPLFPEGGYACDVVSGLAGFNYTDLITSMECQHPRNVWYVCGEERMCGPGFRTW